MIIGKYMEFDSKGCYSYSKIWAVTIPILLSMLVEHVIGMTDTAFLGRVSEVALGASALGSVYYLAFFVIGSGFSFGAQILIARRNGERNYRRTGQICYAGGFFLTILALLLMAGVKYLSPEILPLMVKSDDVCKATIEYLDWRAYGLLFSFVAGIFRAFYVGIARTKILTYSSIAMVLSNVLLNYALIFGKYGFPKMGIAGAALASSIAEAISMLFFIFYTLKFVDLKKYGFHSFYGVFNKSILKRVFSISFWMMLQPFLSISVWFFFFIAVERLGERPLAVVNLARALSALAFIVIHAFATAANSLVSNIIGEGKCDQVGRLICKVMVLSHIITVPMLAFMALFPELCLQIYTDNTSLIADTVNVVYVMCIASGFQISAFIMFNSVSGTGAVKMTVLIESITLFLYAVFVWLVIIRMRPTPAVAWGGEIQYQVVVLILCFWYLLSGKWKDKKL